MKFYLSSYKIGNNSDELVRMMAVNKKIGYIPNALDFTKADLKRRAEHIEADVDSLREIGLVPEVIDLKNYFGKQQALLAKLNELGGIWVSGGNTFVFRQAMALSGLDKILHEIKDKNDFVYGGYSAAGCVLSPSLNGYEIVDNPNDFPYAGIKETIWEGLGFIDYVFLPHWDSDHPESADIEKEIEYCKNNNLKYEAIRDGDVIIVEKD